MGSGNSSSGMEFARQIQNEVDLDLDVIGAETLFCAQAT